MSGIEEQPLREFYDYWSQCRNNRAIPRRKDIDPVDIPQLLPSLMLLEVHPAPHGDYHFWFRLVGTAICDIAGTDLTGRWLHEMFYPGPYVSYLVGLNREVVKLGRPTYSRTVLMLGGGVHHRTTSRVICPLGEDPGQVTMIVACQVFDSRPTWTPMVEEEDYDFKETLHEVLD